LKTSFDFIACCSSLCSHWIVDDPRPLRFGATYSVQTEDMMSELLDTLLGLATPVLLAAPKKKVAKKKAAPKKKAVKKATPKKKAVKKAVPAPVVAPAPPPPPPAAPVPPPTTPTWP
jgi:hypothetical protein